MRTLTWICAFFFCFLFSRCSPAKIVGEQNQTNTRLYTYCVFDSLDQYFAKKIGESTRGRPAGFIVDAKCTDCFVKPVCKECWYEFWKMGLVYDDEIKSCPEIKDALKRSRRVMIVDNTAYPIFFVGIDDVFTKTKKYRNKPTKSIKSLCYHPEKMIIVDMQMKYFYPGDTPLPQTIIVKRPY